MSCKLNAGCRSVALRSSVGARLRRMLCSLPLKYPLRLSLINLHKSVFWIRIPSKEGL